MLITIKIKDQRQAIERDDDFKEMHDNQFALMKNLDEVIASAQKMYSYLESTIETLEQF